MDKILVYFVKCADNSVWLLLMDYMSFRHSKIRTLRYLLNSILNMEMRKSKVNRGELAFLTQMYAASPG